MKLTLKQLHEASQAINVIADEKPKSAKLAYKLSRVVTSARAELELLQKQQAEMLREHGNCVDETEGRWVIAEEKLEDFNSQWADLLETEVEVWGNPIKVDDLNGDLNLSVGDYSRLNWLFTDD